MRVSRPRHAKTWGTFFLSLRDNIPFYSIVAHKLAFASQNRSWKTKKQNISKNKEAKKDALMSCDPSGESRTPDYSMSRVVIREFERTYDRGMKVGRCCSFSEKEGADRRLN
ncbi:hypothetical protein M7I_1764 [Glarea lozoyensis 74030]|uniref:Uncharacterized protein n=1 Tax=Glarea lozoyensis (strain ATCC 74030 / MF5533) TaxID=1104152 RepID=H0EH29_GLAL7|nr:hypothetical protein M7I_1764 [Glarea lozoyensis 74030]